MIKNLFILLFLLNYLCLFAQTKIEIANKSFEDFPRQGVNFLSLGGWVDCGGFRFPGQTPPDIHPGNFWSNNNPPSHGETYLGMVVRDNKTWEAVAQRLSTSLKGNICYKFTIDLARSKKYLSKSPLTAIETNYVEPIILSLWAGKGICDDRELLAASSAVDHEDWKTYQFKIKPQKDYDYLMLEAFYKSPVNKPYCGHVLVDNLSDFIEIGCDTELEKIVSKTRKR
jgi:hypothetical protein